MDRDTSSELRSLWGSSSTNVFTVGSFGTILKYAPPVIYTILPNEGYQGETLSVAITGANFSGVTAVQFGAGISVNSFSVTGSNRVDVELTITSGAETGARNVTVTTTGGSFTYVDGFTVKLALPVITSLEPNEGRQGETLNVTITGSNLSGATALSFGDGVSVNSFTVLGANQIAANISVTPDAETGVRDISVSTPAGSFTYSDGFTVKQDLPLITSVEPSEERQGETLNVTITGANLSNASAVQFGAGISVNSFTVIAADQITADITISSSATTGVRTYGYYTGGSYTLPNAFTVKQALPVITYIEPNQGRQGETLNITITGANLAEQVPYSSVQVYPLTDLMCSAQSDSCQHFYFLRCRNRRQRCIGYYIGWKLYIAKRLFDKASPAGNYIYKPCRRQPWCGSYCYL